MKVLNRISVIMMIALFAIGMNTTVMAQGQRPPQGQGERNRMPKIDAKKIVSEQMKWFNSNMELSEDQAKKIEEIHVVDAQNKKTIMESGLTPRDDEFREKMAGMEILKEAELKDVLSEEQWAIFENKKDEYAKIGRPTRQQRPQRGRQN